MVGPEMVILGEFSGHMTSKVGAALVDCGVFIEFIPDGYTWKLQVLDVDVRSKTTSKIATILGSA